MRRLVVLVLLSLGIVLSFPSAGVASAGITVVSSGAEADFPIAVTFTVEAQSNSQITGIDLLYTVNRRSLVPVDCRVALDFTPAQEVEASWTWDMLETGGLPTGSEIEYSWIIEDELKTGLKQPLASSSSMT